MPPGDIHSAGQRSTRIPSGQGRASGGFERGNKPTRALRAAVAVVRFVADEHGTPTTPAVAVGSGIPSSTEEGSSFLRSSS